MTRRAFFAALVTPVVACVYTMRAPEGRPWFLREDGYVIWDRVKWYEFGIMKNGRYVREALDVRGTLWQQVDKGPWERTPAASYAAILDPSYAASLWLLPKGMVPRKAGTIR